MFASSWAYIPGHHSIARWLLDKSRTVNPGVANSEAIYMASGEGHSDVVNLLLRINIPRVRCVALKPPHPNVQHAKHDRSKAAGDLKSTTQDVISSANIDAKAIADAKVIADAKATADEKSAAIANAAAAVALAVLLKTQTHYVVLGIPTGTSESGVHKAYLRGAQLNHPDKPANRNDACKMEIFKRMNEAHRVLYDKDSRKHYDWLLGVVHEEEVQEEEDKGDFDMEAFCAEFTRWSKETKQQREDHEQQQHKQQQQQRPTPPPQRQHQQRQQQPSPQQRQQQQRYQTSIRNNDDRGRGRDGARSAAQPCRFFRKK